MWCARGKWRCISQRCSRCGRCRKSAAALVDATIPPCCMRSAKSKIWPAMTAPLPRRSSRSSASCRTESGLVACCPASPQSGKPIKRHGKAPRACGAGLAESLAARHPYCRVSACFLDSAMKVTVERSELLKSLGHVHRVVERRNTIPILANVLLRGDRSKLSLKATDLDIEVVDSIAAEVAPGGSTTVPAHMFFDIVRKLPEGAQIALESSGDRAALAIRAGRSRFTLQTLPESDFPDLSAGEMTHKFTLKASELRRL